MTGAPQGETSTQPGSTSTQGGMDLSAWIGRTEENFDVVTAPLVERIAATLDREDARPRQGDPLPPGWYAVLFPRIARRSLLGRDGHPRLGDFLPPVGLPRRMFAGRRVTFHAPLQVGDEVRRVSEIASIEPKEGRSGKMVFVTVRHAIESPRGLAIVEEQDIVYREERTASAAAPRVEPAPQDGRRAAAWTREHVADEVTLFRYSALTFNGHRIHYDLPYVTGVEGYPGLVVNGGLTTLYLCELLRERSPRPLRSIGTRNLKPLFAGVPFSVCAEPDGNGGAAAVWAETREGTVILEGRCEFA